MKVVVCGFHLDIKKLIKFFTIENAEIVIISDSVEAEFSLASEDIQLVKKNPIYPHVLNEFAVGADFILVITENDVDNLLISGHAMDLGIPVRFALIQDSRIVPANSPITHVLKLENLVSEEILRIFENPNVRVLFEVDSVLFFTIKSTYFTHHKSFSEILFLLKIHDSEIVLHSIKAENESSVSDRREFLEEGDLLLISASRDVLHKLESFFFPESKSFDKIFVSAEFYLIANLMKYFTKYSSLINIIEADQNRCRLYSEAFPKCNVKYFENSLLSKEIQFSKHSFVISGVANSKLNILTAITLEKIGISKVVAISDKSSINFEKLFDINVLDPNILVFENIISIVKGGSLIEKIKTLGGYSLIIKTFPLNVHNLIGKKIEFLIDRGIQVLQIFRDRGRGSVNAELVEHERLLEGDILVLELTVGSIQILEKLI